MKFFRKYKRALGALLLLAIPSFWALINFPYLFSFSRYLYGYPSDKLTMVWECWWKNETRTPWFAIATGGIDQVLYQFLCRFLSFLLGEIVAFNFLYFLTFCLSFFSLYFLAKKLILCRSAAVVATVIYSFSQYLLWHAMQNPEISLAAALLPVYFWFVIKTEEDIDSRQIGIKRLWFWSLGTAFLFSLVFLISFYLGYFTVLATGIFVAARRVYGWWKKKIPLLSGRVLSTYLFLGLIVFVLTLPGTLPFIKTLGSGEPQMSVGDLRQGLSRNKLADLIAYGARPWDYLLPSVYHPVFGGGVRQFYVGLREHASYQWWSVFLPERPNYLTFTALGLAAYAVWLFLRRSDLGQGRTFADDRRNILAFTSLAFLMFLVSLPAVITVRGINFYLPSFFLFKVFPMFRVYARAGVFVLLGVSILAGYGCKFLLEKVNGLNFRFQFVKRLVPIVLVGGLLGIVAFENLNFPPYAVMDTEHIPSVYAWLRDQPGDSLIAEYPVDNSLNDIGGGCPDWLPPDVVRDYNQAYEFFYQRTHHRMILDYQQLSKKERAALGDLSSPRTYEILSHYGVDYVVVHIKDPLIGIHPWPYPQENPLDECWQRRVMQKPEKVFEKLNLVAEFEDGLIYQLQKP